MNIYFHSYGWMVAFMARRVVLAIDAIARKINWKPGGIYGLRCFRIYELLAYPNWAMQLCAWTSWVMYPFSMWVLFCPQSALVGSAWTWKISSTETGYTYVKVCVFLIVSWFCFCFGPWINCRRWSWWEIPIRSIAQINPNLTARIPDVFIVPLCSIPIPSPSQL